MEWNKNEKIFSPVFNEVALYNFIGYLQLLLFLRDIWWATEGPLMVLLAIVCFCLESKFKEEGSRFGHFGGFVLDFTMFIC